MLKEAKEFFDPNLDLLSKMTLYYQDAERLFHGRCAIKQRIVFGKLFPFSGKEDLVVEKAELREGEPAAGDQGKRIRSLWI